MGCAAFLSAGCLGLFRCWVVLGEVGWLSLSCKTEEGKKAGKAPATRGSERKTGPLPLALARDWRLGASAEMPG